MNAPATAPTWAVVSREPTGELKVRAEFATEAAAKADVVLRNWAGGASYAMLIARVDGGEQCGPR